MAKQTTKTAKKKKNDKPTANVTVNTAYYTAVHGKEPTPKQKGTYIFQPPRLNQPWQFEGAYEDVKLKLAQEAYHNCGDGEYVLLP